MLSNAQAPSYTNNMVSNLIIQDLVKSLENGDFENAKKEACQGPDIPYCGGPLRMIAYDEMIKPSN